MPQERAGLEFARSTFEVQDAQLQRSARRWRTVLRSVFALLALLVWLAFVEDAAHERRLTLAAVAQRDANLATAVEHYIVRVLRSARAIHGLLGSMLADGHSDSELEAMLGDRLRANDAFSELGLCLPDGRVLPAARGAVRLGVDACAQVRAAVRAGPEITVLPLVGAPGGLQVPLALPVQDAQGRLLAVAVAFTPVGTMLGIMQSAVLHDATTVVVAGDDGIVRAAWRSEAGHVTDPAGFAALGDLLRSGGGTAMIGNRKHLVSSRAVPQAGLRIQVATATGDALRGFYDRRLRLLALCALVSVGLGGVYLLLARMQAEGMARASALSHAQQELQEMNEQLDHQVQERTAQLAQAYRDLETFSFTVAHDVRAPLASISGFADALEPAVAATGNDRHLHYLRRIKANAQQMDELTQHLLELGRLTRAPLARTEVHLGAMAHEVIGRLREADPHRAVQVTIEDGLTVTGDRALLRQVLENLLGNAWKFTSRRPQAHVALRRHAERSAAGEPVFVVSDDGDGFDSEQASGLFEPFRRMHGSGEFPGSGVGLATVQRIVALHGGRVWAQSQPGAGARFYFTLPA